MTGLGDELGLERVLEPRGSLPQAALRLDPSPPVQPHEFEIDVEMLCLDSTSFRQISVSCEDAPDQIAKSIGAIVAAKGKMHNPVTGSGGILTGTVSAVGQKFRDPPNVGDRIVTLASLTLTPLRLSEVGRPLPGTARVPVEGTAYLPTSAPWTYLPDDIPLAAALNALDVCNAASETRSLVGKTSGSVLVLGGGHAGLLALAASRSGLGADRELVLMDADENVCVRALNLGLCDRAIPVDLRDPVAALSAFERTGADRPGLTVVVVNATDCEAAALLLTAGSGTVLFFSMATSFTQAALVAEGMSSTACMIVGSGYAIDRGAYALDLLRQNPALMAVFDETACNDETLPSDRG